MKNTWKKIISLALAMMMILGTVTACGTDGKEKNEPVVQESAEEAKVLKVLTLGHSLALDSGYMLNLICGTEGVKDYDEVIIGTLYYSGCSLSKHVKFMEEDSTEYELHISSSKTPNEPPKVMYQIDMRSAVIYDYWDIVVMQDGVFEIAQSSSYTMGNADKIQKFVEENRLNTRVRYAWHMTWVAPTDNTLRDKFPYEPNTYYSNYERYNHDRTTVYNAVAKCVNDHVLTDDSFEFVIPSATAFENALSSYLEETDLHRDYVHATDLGRVIAAYTWYCKLMGIEKLEEIKLSAIPVKFLNSTTSTTDVVLTDTEKAVILESVNNALANPTKMTQSKYTEAK